MRDSKPIKMSPDEVMDLFLIFSMHILELVKRTKRDLIRKRRIDEGKRVRNLNLVTRRPLGRIPSVL